MELSTGGVEGALFVFPAVVDRSGAAVLMNHIADKSFFVRPFSERGLRSRRG